MTKICVICDYKLAKVEVFEEELEYREQKGSVKMKSIVCPKCGEETADSECMKFNLDEYKKFKTQVENNE